MKKVELKADVEGEKAEFMQVFIRNTSRKKLAGNRYIIKCSRGNWAVDGRDEEEVIKEAVVNFLPYFESGDYDGAVEIGEVDE